MSNETDREKWISGTAAVFVILLVTALHGFLATRLSLWTDELAAIDPALRPWSGEGSFWWQIRQYIANPPGENLLLRVLYKCTSLQWLREASQEFFWRMPYIFAYALTALATYFYARKWSGSSFVACTLLALFLSSPGPFYWATETRFYTWAIFFMTCAMWEGLLFIESGFDRKHFVRVSAVATLGVLFHVSMALICNLLLGYALFITAQSILKWRRERRLPVSSERKKFLYDLLIGAVPFLVYAYEKRYWMYVPSGPSLRAILDHPPEKVIQLVLSHSGLVFPWWPIGPAAGWSVFVLALVAIGIFALRKRDFTAVWTPLFILAVSVGGPLALVYSSAASGFDVMARHFLFVIPALLCGIGYLVFGRVRGSIVKIPSVVRLVLSGVFLLAALANDYSFARSTITYGSPAKINNDLATFKSFYSALPDRRKLVLVGVGDGKTIRTNDVGGWIGETQTLYSADFSPHFLNSRETPPWKLPATAAEWSNYDFLIFVPKGKEPPVAHLDWSRLKCTTFSWGHLRFCR